MRILVAGASGYLGRYVALEFKKRGHWIRVLVREKSLHKLKEIGPFLQPPIKDQVDDIFIGEVTDRVSLKGIMDGIDVVFSSVGITRQRDPVGIMEVDYGGNKNLLDLALEKGVRKFIFVSAFNAHLFGHLEIVRAREKFVEDLTSSGIDCAVVRPTGLFSDSSEFLRMALKGRAYLIGDGHNRVNPIHGADLAEVCADALESDLKEIPVGGPQVFTYREIAELAFRIIGKSPRITNIPPGLMRFIAGLIKPFNSKYHTLARFFTEAMTHDFVAPPRGKIRLEDYFRELLDFWEKKGV
ncbi:MAG: SDR family oxidoreductase [Candidatus Hydrothermae bacterium]|nr:SDR family oxidoreductase [Candidatus Hydrothermae bacterium]